MDKQLYDQMDWAAIEDIVYAETAIPKKILGAHQTDVGLLICTFIPGAQKITLRITATNEEYPMENVDEAGFFAVLLPDKELVRYTLLVMHTDESIQEIFDPYVFSQVIQDEDTRRFTSGIHYEIYEKLGSHPICVDGVEGVLFAVWAPNAMRVSVVGDFNHWDGRCHLMNLIGESGIFELFIPDLQPGVFYKYEIKSATKEVFLKADPYANYAQLRPDTASIVWDLNQFVWDDESFMEKRVQFQDKVSPISIYELHLGSFIRREEDKGGSCFYNYKELAKHLAVYIKDMGYTHVELLPIMEHPLDASWGYQVTGYYAPTSRYGTPDDFKYFVNYLHKEGIGVILDWVPAHFPKDSFGLSCFDGTHLYEHQDKRQGEHPHWGTLIYNYGRPQVSNFLIGNALFWVKEYHIDGIRMDAVASMLYLDYGKEPGQWIPNQYGGHENLDSVEFLKHLNSILKEQKEDVLLIAEESTAWPSITGEVKTGAMGFDYKWNMGWMNDFTKYMQCDPFFRNHNYHQLTFSMEYAYSEQFVLIFSHDEVVHGKGSMVGKMPGNTMEEKIAHLKCAYGFMMAHPGKKLLFMGQDFGQLEEWNENKEVSWHQLKDPLYQSLHDYVRVWNHFYVSNPALYELDCEEEGFTWVCRENSKESIIGFLRKTKNMDETLLFMYNFDTIARQIWEIDVPEGIYTEILSSNEIRFGGTGEGNKEAIKTKQGRMSIYLPALSVVVFHYEAGTSVKMKKGL